MVSVFKVPILQMSYMLTDLFFNFLKFYSRQRERERERHGCQSNIDVKETAIGCLPHAP